MLEKFRKLKKSHKVAVILLALSMVWIGSGLLFGVSEKAVSVATEAGGVDLSNVIKSEKLTPQPKIRRITIYGVTEAKRKVNIKPETEGKLIEINAKEGSIIRQGDLILTLDPRDRKARIAQTEALVEQRKLEWEAAKSLQQKGFRTEVGLAEAKTNWENAKADLLRAKLDFEHTFIRAPFDGILEKVNADIGDFVAVGFFGGEAALATMVDYDPILIVGQVPEVDRSAVKIGEKAIVKLSDKREAEGIVTYLGSVADTASRTFRVEVEVANPDRAIATGVTAEMLLPAGTVDAFLVSPSILSLDDHGIVGVKTVSASGVVEFHPIKTLGDSKEGIWITGISGQDAVITSGQAFAKPGQSISLATLQPADSAEKPQE